MEIAIRTRDLEWNENLRKLVERRIDYAVDRHKSRIGRISACLSDLNGPRGGMDKLCQMTAGLLRKVAIFSKRSVTPLVAWAF